MPRKSAAALAFPGVIRTERLTAPADLNPDERAVFVGIVGTVAADHFRPSDLPLLSAYVRAIVREREASEHLAQGVVSIDNKLSSWVTVQAQALKQMLSLARMLKLTPLARRSNPSRSGKPQQLSYYEQMRLEQFDAADEG
jgi:phage terminase small subunit